ncbi:hypothetical protein VTG60DRAFT_2457 [Thermothelomyces hinnuleus]
MSQFSRSLPSLRPLAYSATANTPHWGQRGLTNPHAQLAVELLGTDKAARLGLRALLAVPKLTPTKSGPSFDAERDLESEAGIGIGEEREGGGDVRRSGVLLGLSASWRDAAESAGDGVLETTAEIQACLFLFIQGHLGCQILVREERLPVEHRKRLVVSNADRPSRPGSTRQRTEGGLVVDGVATPDAAPDTISVGSLHSGTFTSIARPSPQRISPLVLFRIRLLLRHKSPIPPTGKILL